MNPFWQSETYQVIKAMKATGNEPGMIARWIEGAALWAQANTGPDAAAIKAVIPLWQVRPFYTAAELSPLFPALIVGMGLSRYVPPVKSPKRLAFELDYGGLPKLRNHMTGGHGFRDQFGHMREYYIVEQIGQWSKKSLTQEEFENVLFG